jgi:hypothetical protein
MIWQARSEVEQHLYCLGRKRGFLWGFFSALVAVLLLLVTAGCATVEKEPMPGFADGVRYGYIALAMNPDVTDFNELSRAASNMWREVVLNRGSNILDATRGGNTWSPYAPQE